MFIESGLAFVLLFLFMWLIMFVLGLIFELFAYLPKLKKMYQNYHDHHKLS